MNNVSAHKSRTVILRDNRSGQTPPDREGSASPTLLNPYAGPVRAGDIGPGTWVVELSDRALPLTVPNGAIPMLAGCVSPYAYVAPIRPESIAARTLRSIA